MGVQIIIDSTADVREAVREQFTVVPLTVMFGKQEFVDGVTIDHRQFYEKLEISQELPTTSQPTPAAFAQVYEEIVEAGDTAVVITISSHLSGTYQSASIAAEEYPDQIFVVDSLSVTIGAGILAERALQLARQGLSAAQVAQAVTEERKQLQLFAILDTLEYLKKGGRISKAVAFAGGVLSIKPVVSFVDGKIAILGKGRGNKQANAMLIQQMESSGGIDLEKPLFLGYTGLSDALLQQFRWEADRLWQGAEHPQQTIVGSVVGTHAGPGAVAVAYFKKS